MAAAIWMIIYDLDRAHSARYLQWFNDVHIPEKLARPGYTWAAHYQIIANDVSADSRYIALFGGTDSRVFYNPSPAQIKPNQSPETRTMMSYRANSEMLILTEEWASDGDTGLETSPLISAPSISLALFNANENDENLGAWLVQDYLVNSAGSGVTRKFLASTGTARHVLVHESGEHENPRESIVDSSSSDWSAQVSNSLSYPSGDPLVARRVWPEIAPD
jgi:hypothetical protein